MSWGWVSYDQGSRAADSRLDATTSLSCSSVSGLGGQAGRLVNPILVHSPASASSPRPFRSLFPHTLSHPPAPPPLHTRYTALLHIRVSRVVSVAGEREFFLAFRNNRSARSIRVKVRLKLVRRSRRSRGTTRARHREPLNVTV